MGRPSTRPKKLKDGFYIEVKAKGADGSIKIRRDTKEEALEAMEHYKRSKTVENLGEMKNGKWVDGKKKK
jgi:hypothetical protein